MRKNYYGTTTLNSKVTGYWEIDVGIPYDLEIDVDDSNVNAIVGYQSHSSGAGFGYRDLQYAVSTPWRARRLATEIRELLGISYTKQPPQDGEPYVGCYYSAPNFVWRFRDWWEG